MENLINEYISASKVGTATDRSIRLFAYYPRRARSAIGVDIVLTLDVCMYVCLYVSALERKRLIGMT